MTAGNMYIDMVIADDAEQSTGEPSWLKQRLERARAEARDERTAEIVARLSIMSCLCADTVRREFAPGAREGGHE